MSYQDKYEPPYPQNQLECNEYCERLVAALSSKLKDRLVCVLLSGSWATGEAKPPKSDIDISVVVDYVDDNLLDSLREAWKQSKTSYANIYGLDEIDSMSHEAFHMYTFNAVLLYGTNPFPYPDKKDFALDLASTTEVMARMARNIEFAYWLTEEEISDNLSYLLSKNCLRRTLMNLVAFRTGRYPGKFSDCLGLLENDNEYDFIIWLESLTDQQKLQQHSVIARKLSQWARDWFKEIRDFRTKSGKDTVINIT